MGTSLVTAQKENRLAMSTPEYSNEQIKLLAETVAKGCDQNELAFFLQVAKLKRLDPFSGQIHVVKRWDSSLGKEKISVQVGVDGYRAIASRTGDLAGIDDPEYDTDVEDHPSWAKITVYRYGRGDEKIGYKATARWGEYVQTYKDKQTGELKPNPMWKRMPYLMLGKVAEALALRKAFPDELSGMYTNEEMGQADNETPGVTPASVMKPQVSMPKSTDETKAQLQQGKAQTVQQNPPAQQNAPAAQTGTQGQQEASLDKLSGEIASVTPGKNGLLVLAVNGGVVLVPGRLATDDFVTGAKILCSVKKVTVKGQNCLEVIGVEMIVPPAEEGEIIDADVSEPEPSISAEEGAAYVSDLTSDLFGSDTPKTKPTSLDPPGRQTSTATEATKPGTAGIKRAQRLHTLISQNARNTLFTEELLKKYLATQQIEHARDLACPPKGSDAFNAYEYACSMAVGEVDWHEVLDD